MEFFSKLKLLALSAFMLFALGSSGCTRTVSDFKKASTINRVLASWVGHRQSELLAFWGPPTKVVSDGKGGKMVIYESLKGRWGDQTKKPIVGGAHYFAKPTQPGYTATRTFYVNEKGIVYAWKWSGL